MSTWDRWRYPDGWCYARRTDRRLSDAEKDYGLVELVEARSYVLLADRVDEQDALDREYQEQT